MPICKNCKSRIDKFNKDRCPICGVENPFEDVSSQTVEVTTSIDVDSKDYHPRKRLTACLLSALLGIFGVQFFYLYQKKMGLIYACINLVCLGLVGFLLGYLTPLHYVVSFVITYAALTLVNVCVGLYLYFKPNLKDGRGDFLL